MPTTAPQAQVPRHFRCVPLSVFCGYTPTGVSPHQRAVSRSADLPTSARNFGGRSAVTPGSQRPPPRTGAERDYGYGDAFLTLTHPSSPTRSVVEFHDQRRVLNAGQRTSLRSRTTDTYESSEAGGQARTEQNARRWILAAAPSTRSLETLKASNCRPAFHLCSRVRRFRRQSPSGETGRAPLTSPARRPPPVTFDRRNT